MRFIASLMILLFVSAACTSQNGYQHHRLTKLWETDQVFKVPESVYHDAEAQLLYVSNINGNPTDQDNNGFLSKLDMDGNILELEWISGLHAPKGMGRFGDKLYVTDIVRVAEIDLTGDSVLNYYPAEGAQFLNDIAIDTAGNVYISDMKTNKIHRFKDDTLEVWLESDILNTPNGLFVEDDALLIGISGAVLKVGLDDKEMETFISNTGGIDGLGMVGSGTYIISDWAGNVHLIYPEKEKLKILDTTPVKVNAADIDFNVREQVLLVPTFFDNRVVAYKLKP